ncbi:hypothetical protein [Sphingomonas sp. GB1N7]|uniref:hypothetical protein n=1 Tax=Parasphingomonas caseinilytica TaxID=3096158 RepID=UPI002FCA7C0B
MYILSFASFALSFDLYDEKAAKDLLHVINLPAHALSVSVAFGLSYLGLQYILLVCQLIVTYDITLDERLVFRREDELAIAREKETKAKIALDEAKANLSTPELRKLRNEIATLSAENAKAILDTNTKHELGVLPIRIKSVTPTDEEIRQAKISIRNRTTRLKKLRDEEEWLTAQVKENDDPSWVAAYKTYKGALLYRYSVFEKAPASRMGYTLLERIIDGARVVPPIGVVIFALCCLAYPPV